VIANWKSPEVISTGIVATTALVAVAITETLPPTLAT
jgi:hypothetical protein